MSERNCSTCDYEGAPVKSARCNGCYGTDGLINWDSSAADEARMDVIGQNGPTGEHYDHIPDATKMVPITAPDLLQRAAEIMIERGRQYDKPEGERSMGAAVAAFNAITGRDLKESEGWLLLQVLKDVRQWQRPEYHQDSAEDCTAYSALKAEALAKGV